MPMNNPGAYAPQQPQPFFQQVAGDPNKPQSPMMDSINKLADQFGAGAEDARLGLYEWVLTKKAAMGDQNAARELDGLRQAEQKRKGLQ